MNLDPSSDNNDGELMAAEGQILVTGSGGFLGGHLVSRLGEERCLTPRSKQLDLLQFSDVCDYVAEHQPSHIIHAAGFVGGIGLHQAHPGRLIADNLRMGLNVLEAAARVGGIHVTIVSTVCVYPEHAPIPTPEESLFEGYPAPATAAYGIAKRTLFEAARALAAEHGLSFSYVVPTNFYGPGDYFDAERSHVVAALVARAEDARERAATELVVWGDGSPTRDLLYVEDAARGIIMTLDEKARGQAFNLGSGRETSIRELAELICRVVGFDGELRWDTSKAGGAPRRALDSRRAERILGYRAQVPLEQGLERMVARYRSERMT